MQAEKHIINKVFLEVHTRSSKTAYELKDHLDVYVREKLLPYLEDYFDSVMKTVAPDTHFQFDKIDIDLSANEPLDLTDLKFRIKNKIEKDVEEAKVFNRSDVILSPKGRLKDGFFQFLETGMNPWWNHSKKITALEDPVAFNTLISSDKFALELGKRIQEISFRERLIKQLSDVQLAAIITENLPAPLPTRGTITKIAAYINEGVAESGPLNLVQRLLLWDIVLCSVLNPRGVEIKHKLFRLIKSLLRASFEDDWNFPLEMIIFEFLQAKTPVAVLSDFEDQVSELKKEIKAAIFESNKKPSGKEGTTPYSED